MIKSRILRILTYKQGILPLSIIALHACTLTCVAYRQQSNAVIALAMCDLNAEYQLAGDSVFNRSNERETASASLLGTFGNQPNHFTNLVLGVPLSKEIRTLRLQEMNSTDQQLNFIDDLVGLEALELTSDRATDETLAKIADLPNLKQLKLGGRQFTFDGLLQLRESQSLQELVFEAPHLTDIEEAVVIAELPFACRKESFLPAAQTTAPSQLETVERTVAIPYEI